MAKMKILSAKANEISESISAVCKEYVQIKSQTKAAQAQYAESGKKYNELKASKQAEKDAIESELAGLKGKVDGALMEKYLKKRAMKMYPIVSLSGTRKIPKNISAPKNSGTKHRAL